ncbi:MAG: YkgJ family cysteine cluster protein [Verrucomicrobiae bacterium]
MSDAPGTARDEAAMRLCAACGMCCSGVMFHSVRLQPGDSARELAALGLKVKRGTHIPQPCPAHRGSCCGIYGRRPARCRLFVCRQIRAVAAGSVSEAAALEKIREAMRRVERVRDLFRLAGDAREHKAFATRHEAIFTGPLDPSPPAARLRADLASAMAGLERILTENFRIATVP